MNKWKGLAIVFGLITLGTAEEMFRIVTSDTPDIADNRTELVSTAIITTLLFLFLTIKFWFKDSRNTHL